MMTVRDPIQQLPDGTFIVFDINFQGQYGPYPTRDGAAECLRQYNEWLVGQGLQPHQAPGSGIDAEALVAERQEVKATLEAMEAAHKDAAASLKQKLEELDGRLLQVLIETKQSSFKAAGCTVFAAEKFMPSIGDKEAFNNFIRQTGNVELLSPRVSSSTLKEYMEAHGGEAPPGISIRVERELRVRRS